MSFPQIGLGAKTGFKLETVYGTKASPCSDMIDITSGDVAGTNMVESPLTQHGHREMLRTLQGKYDVGGSIKMPIQLQGVMGLLLNSCFGKVVTTDNGDGTYTHVFTVASSPYSATTYLPSYTIYRDKLLGIFSYAGCIIQDVTFSTKAGAVGECDFTVVGRSDEEDTQQPTLTYPTAALCSWYNATISINGSPFTITEGLTAKFANDIEKVNYLDGTRFIGAAVPKQFNTDIDFEMAFNGMDMVRRLWGNVSATSPTFTIVANTIDINITSPSKIGASNRYYQLGISLPEGILFGDMPQVGDANARIMQSLKFKARFAQSQQYGVQVTLVNDTASYAV